MVRTWCAFVAALCASSLARANPLELVGLTSRYAAQANAGVASADDAAALYYDPAGLAVEPGKELSIGFVGAYSSLRANGDRQKLAEPYGFQLVVRAPAPLRGDLGKRIVVGTALHLLPGSIARIVAPAPADARYAYWDRMSRIVILPGAGVRIADGVWLGASVDILAGLTGRISASEGLTRALDARVDERIPTVARVIAGASWRPVDAVRLGVVYRQRFEVPFRTEARTIVGGEPIDLDLRATGLFSPHAVVAGGAYTLARARIALDVGWSKWSDYPGPYVQVDSRLPLVGAIAGDPPKLAYRDTIAARIGFETRRIGCGPIARAGYAFETSAIPDGQTGVSNLLDGTHHTIALGGGWQFRGGRVRLDAHVQLSLVGARDVKKKLYSGGDYDPATSLRDEDTTAPGLQIDNPGYPGMTSGGRVVAAGLTLEVGL